MKRIGAVFLIVCVLILVSNATIFGQPFAPAVHYNAGSSPRSVHAADLDGDGYADIVVSNETQNTISILKNNGYGIFQSPVSYGVGNHAFAAIASDLDIDGNRDLAVVNTNSGNISILRNNGDGTFQSAVNYGAGSFSRSIFACDLDGDNDKDLAVANLHSDVSVLINNGNGSFQAPIYYGSGSGGYSIYAADLDGDIDMDLAVVNHFSDNVSVLKNNGNGTFQAAVNYGVGDGPYSVVAADLDYDGDTDLAVANGLSDDVSVLMNNGDGIFQTPVDYGGFNYPIWITACDFDGDGNSDLATANVYSDDVSFMMNNGDGTFGTPLNYAVGDAPHSVHAADLDGDGDSDLSVANNSSSTVSILINLKPRIGSICVSVNTDESLPVQGVIVTVIDENNDLVGDPIPTDESGEAYFDSIPAGQYSVMIVTPLGYSVSPAETQTNVEVIGGDCTQVDFVLTPTVVTNDSRTIGYWKHQFNVYTSGRGNPQESYSDLEALLDLVHQHFNVLAVYVDLENFDFEDAKNILTVRGGSLTLDRAKQKLFAMLLNFASGRIGNETIVSDDDRVAAEAVTMVANLINDGDPANDETAKVVCDLINNGQMVEAGIVPESPIRYKFALEHIPRGFSLGHNFPNPFNSSTVLRYNLPEPSDVIIEIYDFLGRRVETLMQEKQPAGYHQAVWNADDASSGLYFYRIQAGDYAETRKMVLVK
jgi:hypothetical protein